MLCDFLSIPPYIKIEPELRPVLIIAWNRL